MRWRPPPPGAAPSPSQLKMLREYCRRKCKEWIHKGNIVKARQYLFMAFLSCTGARVSEILSLRYLDIDFNEQVIRIPTRKIKWGRGLPIPSWLATLARNFIKRFRIRPDEKLFDFTRVNAWYICNKITKEILGKEYNPHMLRHAVAYLLLSSGLSISDVAIFMGHTDIRTTLLYSQASAVTDRVRKVVCSW